MSWAYFTKVSEHVRVPRFSWDSCYSWCLQEAEAHPARDAGLGSQVWPDRRGRHARGMRTGTQFVQGLVSPSAPTSRVKMVCFRWFRCITIKRQTLLSTGTYIRGMKPGTTTAATVSKAILIQSKMPSRWSSGSRVNVVRGHKSRCTNTIQVAAKIWATCHRSRSRSALLFTNSDTAESKDT